MVVGKGMEKAMFPVRLIANTCHVTPCRNQIVTNRAPRCGKLIYIGYNTAKPRYDNKHDLPVKQVSAILDSNMSYQIAHFPLAFHLC